MLADLELGPGSSLGTYQLLVPLAQGATADVWAARTRGSRLEKIVAVKVMRIDEQEDIEQESMFLDEARLVARLHHPNVASVLDLGEEQGVLFIVVEWIEGEPLQVVMREAWGSSRKQGPTAPPGPGLALHLALRIARQAASGLEAAHELRDDAGNLINLVHRDVSPQNILVSYEGAVKVIDFGVAKAESNIQRTRIGQIKGKVPYMAPEQASGGAVDRRTDVFALGVVLYQLVTGKHPFRGDHEFSTLARLRDKVPFEPPRTHVPTIPDAVNDLIMRAIAKEKQDRFPSFQDMIRAIDQAMPAAAETDDELRLYIGSLLANRAQKRTQQIRDVLAALHAEDAAAGIPIVAVRTSLRPPGPPAISTSDVGGAEATPPPSIPPPPRPPSDVSGSSELHEVAPQKVAEVAKERPPRSAQPASPASPHTSAWLDAHREALKAAAAPKLAPRMLPRKTNWGLIAFLVLLLMLALVAGVAIGLR